MDAFDKYGNVYGETISIAGLMKRWNVNRKLIERRAQEKKLIPYLGGLPATVRKRDGIRIFEFPSHEEGKVISGDEADVQKYDTLPDEVYFHLPDIIEHEDKHLEIKGKSDDASTTFGQQFDLQSLLKIFGRKTPSELLFYDSCEIDDNGIHAKPMDKHSELLLTSEERRIREDTEKK